MAHDKSRGEKREFLSVLVKAQSGVATRASTSPPLIATAARRCRRALLPDGRRVKPDASAHDRSRSDEKREILFVLVNGDMIVGFANIIR